MKFCNFSSCGAGRGGVAVWVWSDLVSWPRSHLTLQLTRPLLLELKVCQCGVIWSSVGLASGVEVVVVVVVRVRCHHYNLLAELPPPPHWQQRESSVGSLAEAASGGRRGREPAYWDSNIDIPLSHHATPHYLIVLALTLHNLHLHHYHHLHHHLHTSQHHSHRGLFFSHCSAAMLPYVN